MNQPAIGGALSVKQLWFTPKLQTSHAIRRGDFVYGSIGGNDGSPWTSRQGKRLLYGKPRSLAPGDRCRRRRRGCQ